MRNTTRSTRRPATSPKNARRIVRDYLRASILHHALYAKDVDAARIADQLTVVRRIEAKLDQALRSLPAR